MLLKRSASARAILSVPCDGRRDLKAAPAALLAFPSPKPRSSMKRSPAQTVVDRFALIGVKQTNKINNHPLAVKLVPQRAKLVFLLGNDDHFGFVDNLGEVRLHQRRDVRDLAFDVVFVRAEQSGELDVPIVDRELEPLADQGFYKRHHRALAQVVGSRLEAQA